MDNGENATSERQDRAGDVADRGPDTDSQPLGFGPLDGLKALTGLQRQGIAAATEVAERFTAMLDGFDRRPPLNVEAKHDPPNSPTDDPDSSNHAADADAMGELRSNMARGFDLYSRMFQSTFEAWADLVEDRMRERGIRLGANDGDVVVVTGPPKGTATGEVWLHHNATEPSGGLHLLATPAFAVDGASVSPLDITFEPAVLQVEPGFSARIAVSVDLHEIDRELVLHAQLLIREVPDEALPVRLVVRHSSRDEPLAADVDETRNGSRD